MRLPFVYLLSFRAETNFFGEFRQQHASDLSPLVRVANHATLLASLPDLAVRLVLSAVVRLARTAALNFVSGSFSAANAGLLALLPRLTKRCTGLTHRQPTYA